LQLFIRLVAISSAHARFRVLEAAGLSFFASAFAARFLLIGSSISFCPAAALRGFLPFAGSAPRSFAMLRFRASIRSTTFSPFGRAFAAIGLPLRFRAKLKHLLCKAAARSAETICVTIGEILRTFTPTECANYSETQPMPDPKSIML
jgi:hypothetical protein